MATIQLAAGAVLGDRRYRLQRRLGSGGMASVWLARDERLARQVAVKVISDSLATDERYRERFAREARAAASVSHPNIVPVYDYGVQGGRPYLVMEYVPGHDLAEAIAAGSPEPLDPVAIARQLMSALECIHGSGLVHRDVKPANILLEAAGRLRLTDFGIAQLEDASSLTQTGMVLGTLRYLAPEVVAGARPGPAADLYAAGVALRELTALKPAPGLTALITALTAADPTSRPSAAEAAAALAAETGPQSSRPPGPAAGEDATLAPRRLTTGATRRLTSPTRRLPGQARPHPMRGQNARRRRAAAAAVAALLVVVVVLIALTSGGGSPPASRSVAGPAPAGAPLASQLRALSRLVDESTKR